MNQETILKNTSYSYLDYWININKKIKSCSEENVFISISQFCVWVYTLDSHPPGGDSFAEKCDSWQLNKCEHLLWMDSARELPSRGWVISNNETPSRRWFIVRPSSQTTGQHNIIFYLMFRVCWMFSLYISVIPQFKCHFTEYFNMS